MQIRRMHEVRRSKKAPFCCPCLDKDKCLIQKATIHSRLSGGRIASTMLPPPPSGRMRHNLNLPSVKRPK